MIRGWLVGGVLVVMSTVACSKAEPVKTNSAATPSIGLAFHATAQKSTTAKYGITKWHSVIEPKSHAIVMDGVDAQGKLKFSSSFRKNTNGDYVIHDNIKNGDLVFDKDGKVSKYTLSASWVKGARLYKSDWNKFQQTVPYGYWSYVSNGLWIAAGATAVVGGALLLPAAIAVGGTVGALAVAGTAVTMASGALGIAAGTTGLMDNFASDKEAAQAKEAQAAKDAAAAAQQQATNDTVAKLQAKIDAFEAQQKPAADTSKAADDPSKDPTKADDPTKTDDPAADKTDSTDKESGDDDDSTFDPSDDAEKDDSTFDPSDDTDSADDAGDEQGDDFPDADDDSDFDDTDLSADSDDVDTSDFDDSSDDSADVDDSSDDSADESDDSGDDLDTESVAFSTGKCRKTTKSKSTGVVICLHY